MKIKKLMSLLLTAALVLSLATPLFAGVEGADYGVVPYSASPIIVDGVMDSAYSNGLHLNAFSVVRGIDTGLSNNIWMVYQDNYLYVFMQVADPDVVVPDAERSKNPWDYDNVELFIDYSGNSYSDVYAGGTGVDTLDQCVQYRLDVSGYPSVYGKTREYGSWNAYGANASAPGAEADSQGRYASDLFKYAANFASDIYTLEYAIPLTNTHFVWGTETLTAGDTFGLNVQITDFTSGSSDTTGYMFSDFDGEWAWDAHLWPKLTLGEKPEYSIEVISEDEKTARITGYSGTSSDIEIPSEINGYTITEIGNQAFFRNNKIKSVVIPGTVENIGAEAFFFCENLTNVTLNEGLRVIQNNAFWGCAFKEIELPESLTDLAYASLGMTGLTSIHIPANVVYIDRAFWMANNLAEITVDSANEVFSAENNVLYYMDEVLWCYPAGLTAKSFEIPQRVTSISFGAFGFSKLESVIFHNKLVEIGASAFWQCNSLLDITIPASVEYIGESAFNYCSSLRGIGVDSENSNYYSKQGVLYSKEGVLVAYPGSRTDNVYYVPDGITTIPYGVISCRNISAIVFPETIKTISLIDCANLKGMFFVGDAPEECSKWNFMDYPIYYIEGKAGWTTPTWKGSENAGYLWDTLTWDGVNIPKEILCNHEVKYTRIEGSTCSSVGKMTSEGRSYSYYCEACDIHFSNSDKAVVVELVEAPLNSNSHEGPFIFGDSDIECTACGIAMVLPEVANLGTVPHAAAPILDGVKDDFYSDGVIIPVDSIVRGIDTGLNAEASVLFSNGYLYVFMDVNDPDLVIPDAGRSKNPWDYENVELFIDFSGNAVSDNVGVDRDYLSSAMQFRVDASGYQSVYGFKKESGSWCAYGTAGAPGSEPDDKGRYANDFFESKTKVTDDGYTIEYKIPLTNTMLDWGEDTIVSGDKFGINIQITDFHTGSSETSGYVLEDFTGSWMWDAHLWPKLTLGQGCSDLEKHDAVEATYESEGNKLYYECTICGKLFEDADAKVETTLEKVTIPKLTNIPVSGISLSASDLRIVSGTSAKIVATLSPENATNKNVVWTSGNKDVATVKDGVVTATGLGNTVITATTEDGEFSASCKIYVVCDHDLEAKTGAVATCSTVGIITSAGSRDYYYCSECDVCYSNEDKDQIVTLIEEAIDPDNHDIKENIAKEATYVSAGNELYYECTLCGKLYEDADCEIETDRASVIIPQMIQVSETGAVEIAVEEIEEVVVKDKATNTVTIPLENTVDHETGEVVAVSTVTLPVEVVSEATENNASLELKTSDSSIKLDTQALATVAEAVNASPESTVELKVQVGTADDSLEEEQIEAVEAHNVDEVAAVVSASIIVDGKTVGSESEGGFNGGSVTISVPFVPTEGSGSDYSILYVPDEGEAVIIDAKYDNATKCLVFTTEHLSEYAIVKLHKCNFTELKLNAAFHWYECSCGEQSAYVAHDYISKNDVKDHWAECSGCGDIIDKAAHVSSGAATETKAETCTECGYVIENALGHSCEKHLTKVPAVKATCETAGNTEYYKCECGRLYKEADAITEFFNEADTVIVAKGHVDSDKDNYCDACDKVLHVCVYKIFNDNYNHWLECSCGDVKDVAAHIESGWIIDVAPQAFESGSRHTECRYCGMIMRAETVDRLGWYDENMFIQSCIIDKKVYTLTSSSSNGGTLSYYGDMVVRNGSVVDYTITPAAGYRIDAVYINGVNIGVVDHYTFNYIKSSATIHVDFEKIQ